jgi:ABC1 atypical kinase-like domain
MVELQRLCDKVRSNTFIPIRSSFCFHTRLPAETRCWCNTRDVIVCKCGAEVLTALRVCDSQVPSYDSKIAFATIERELGKPISEVYSDITPEPLAAASLGQVAVCCDSLVV